LPKRRGQFKGEKRRKELSRLQKQDEKRKRRFGTVVAPEQEADPGVPGQEADPGVPGQEADSGATEEKNQEKETQ
jgi:hypothetical protein